MLALPSFLAPAAVYARLLNVLLKREDWARTRLYPHAGKTVRFVAGPVKISLCVESSGFTQPSDPAVVPDVTLTIPTHQVSKLPSLIKNNDPSQLVAILHIDGDAGLAQTVSDLARDLRWDIEHELASRVGDITAMRLIQTGSIVTDAARKSTRNLSENVSEYLGHESGLLVNRPAFSMWSGDLNDAQRHIEQLEARLNALSLPGANAAHATHNARGKVTQASPIHTSHKHNHSGPKARHRHTQGHNDV